MKFAQRGLLSAWMLFLWFGLAPEVGGQPAGRPPAAVPAPTAGPPQAIAAPFQLTPAQEAHRDQVLSAWEQRTEKIKTFTCKFTRWTYDPAFAAPQYKDQPIVINDGEIRYATPDKGTFRVDRVQRLNSNTGEYEEAKDESGEHWVCNGKSIWEHDYKNKQVIERPIPPELQGQAIRQTPLPFLFGSKAVDLKNRYFLRVVTPQEFAENEIWIDAFPRGRGDAANFQRAILRLDRATFQPAAMRIYDPAGAYKSYSFTKIAVNHPLDVAKAFLPPRPPFGWRRVVETPPEATASRPSEPR
ncbi:MAG: TIGR03009 domain-containing protein [Planctomycetales bacterium]|nr:TIGR03009 domain-containing protein [Planctomycetales bacterium]